jgi:hypothetical protein
MNNNSGMYNAPFRFQFKFTAIASEDAVVIYNCHGDRLRFRNIIIYINIAEREKLDHEIIDLITNTSVTIFSPVCPHAELNAA